MGFRIWHMAREKPWIINQLRRLLLFVCAMQVAVATTDPAVQADIPVSTPQVYLTEKERSWLLEHPVIRLGVNPAWPPVEFINDKGAHKGLSSEYIKIISQMLGVRMTPILGLTWEQVLAGVKAKEIDLLPAVGRTLERENYLNYTEPYMNFPNVVFVREHTLFIFHAKG